MTSWLAIRWVVVVSDFFPMIPERNEFLMIFLHFETKRNSNKRIQKGHLERLMLPCIWWQNSRSKLPSPFLLNIIYLLRVGILGFPITNFQSVLQTSGHRSIDHGDDVPWKFNTSFLNMPQAQAAQQTCVSFYRTSVKNNSTSKLDRLYEKSAWQLQLDLTLAKWNPLAVDGHYSHQGEHDPYSLVSCGARCVFLNEYVPSTKSYQTNISVVSTFLILIALHCCNKLAQRNNYILLKKIGHD